MEGFTEGYKFFKSMAGYTAGELIGDQYIQNINQEIDVLVKNLNSFQGFATQSAQLKGDIAEFWHAGTFNIDAVIKGSGHRATVDRSHDFASVDISTNFGRDYGSKYYRTAQESAKAQSKIYQECYKEYQGKGGTGTYEEFLQERGKAYVDPNSPIYAEQFRLISSDQLQEAKEWLTRKINEEATKRPELVERYQNTLDMLSKKIDDGKGVSSIELSKAEATEIAEIAKEGGISAEGLGLTTEELVKYEYIMSQALKAGLTAATITMILKVAPEIYKSIEYLIEMGEVDAGAFKRIGFAAVSGAGEGFVRGTIAAALTTACKSGLMGEALKKVDPTIIGTVTAIAFNTMKNAFWVANKKMSSGEFVEELVRDMIVSSCSLAGGAVSQVIIEIPVFGYLLGSFAGSMIGSFAYSCGYHAIISFCVESGFTFFGMVDQDYKLPEDVLKEIGIDVFEYEKMEYQKIEMTNFEPARFEAERFSVPDIEITFLRRGVIGVSQVGYVE